MNYISKLYNFLTDSNYRFCILAGYHFYDKMSDEEYLKRKYKAIMGKELDLLHPQTFNEKLQWLKLYDRKPEYTMMVDKYRVREYIAEKIGEEYLIPLLGVWDDPDEIDFDALPNQFVLKCNHNSGLGMCICKDKSKLDIKKVKRELRKGMAQDYYLTGREWPYKNVPRKIICEKYMTDEFADSLTDYKFYCFEGKVKSVGIYQNRNTGKATTVDYFNRDFEWQDFNWGYPHAETFPIKPQKFENMVELAEALSKGFKELRVDLYLCGDKIYFGELTFFDGSGFENFYPESVDQKWGEWIKLSGTGGGYVLKSSLLDEEFTLYLRCRGESPYKVVKQELTDYKFFCFNGIPKFMYISNDYASDATTDFFDMDFNRLDLRMKDPNSDNPPPRPLLFDSLKKIAEQLSSGIPFVRVDMYVINGKIYFGELTFFHNAGFVKIYPEKWEKKLGDWIDTDNIVNS